MRKLLILAGFVFFCAIFAPPALAQAPPVQQKLEEIEKQIQALQRTFAELRASAASQSAAASPTNETGASRGAAQDDPLFRIRDEGLNRSQIMPTISYLTDVIGPRLTGSPNLKRANEWTRDKLLSWGLTNAALEAWGPFGRGWSLKRFSAQVVEPYAFPVIAFPKAWSPGFDQPLTAEVIYLDARSEPELDRYRGKVKGAIVLIGSPREVRARFEPLATRRTETNLLQLANAGEPRSFRSGGPPTAARAGGPGRRGGPASGQFSFQNRVISFLAAEQAGLVLTPSPNGDGGTLFLGAASVPSPGSVRVSAWSTNAPAIPPQATLAIEDYNRLVRMIQAGEKVKMTVELQTQFHEEDLMAYNTVAEIPGTDLKDEVVMLGGHLDSWHVGTGATDNAAGVAVAMEAARIIRALDLKPRRTIRVALWTGEEQGLLGSRAYVAQRFGYFTNVVAPLAAANGGGESASSGTSESAAQQTTSKRTLFRHPAFEKFSAYFNLDNGTGKIRGVYMQGNEAVRPIFRKWLAPFGDLGAETLSLANTAATDHIPFDEIGLPGFQFIQDPIEYSTRTHHSTADVFDRIQADDVKQASVIMAAFAYSAAMLDQKLPRKPAPAE